MTHQKRYTAEEMQKVAISIGDGIYAGVNASTLAKAELMLLQAAHTESQVAGLVEALESIAVRCTHPMDLQEIAREALSKFRGEA